MGKPDASIQMEAIADEISESLEHGIKEGIFPGGVCSLVVSGHPPLVIAKGVTEAGPNGKPVNQDTLYDLASLTKVVVTLPLVLYSVQRGRISLTDPVFTYLPELAKGPDAEDKQHITLYHLLTHSSGLPGWRPYYLQGKGRASYLRLIAEEALIAKPGNQVIYSDLGFILLGFIIEKVWDEPLDQLARRRLFQASGMVTASYNPLEEHAAPVASIAPTEDGNLFEQGMITADSTYRHLDGRVQSFPWRQGVICGTVHDGNAYYGLDGVSGHAGLFSSILDLQAYMKMWREETNNGFLDPVLRKFATRTHTSTFASLQRGLGWEASPTGGTMSMVIAGCTGGDLVSPEAFGHTGFTGTSIWLDPHRQAALITLTNRVNPVVSLQIKQWRRSHHNRIFSKLGTGVQTS